MTGQDYIIPLTFTQRVRFTRDAFAPTNPVWTDLLEKSSSGHETKILVLLEKNIATAFPQLQEKINTLIHSLNGFSQSETLLLTGGEDAKNSRAVLEHIWDATERNNIDRHSYLFAIGGGAFLDVAGLAAATAHRGLRLVRFPTTVLSQDDSGVGVKNGINAYGKKNFLGTFHLPYAVINDFDFLDRLPEHDARAGLIEALKVALVKDASFYHWISENIQALANLERPILEKTIERSAHLHAHHIANGGDPFETGNNRPLDYGHWAAHKLEQLTDFALSHGEAVSIGLALDTLYAAEIGQLPHRDAQQIISLVQTLRLPLWDDALDLRNPETGNRSVIDGLEEFREHLGGQLTLILLKAPGSPFEVHEIDLPALEKSLLQLKALSQTNILTTS